MKIVMVMLNNFQPYILDNIKNLIYFDNKNIDIIIDKCFENEFEGISNISITFVEDLIPSYDKFTADLHKTFRNGFWQLTSYRFFVLAEYMKKYNITNIIHIENDVLVLENLEKIEFHDSEKLLCTMDSENRCIPGMMFIPNYQILEKCLKQYSPNMNDMQLFAKCFYLYPNEIDTLPICYEMKDSKIQDIITRNSSKYPGIFDACAIGQYLGGVDPRNKSGNTVGFVNETCIFDFSKYKFVWKMVDNHKKLFMITPNNGDIQVYNIHVHCKNLAQFCNS